MSKIGEGAGEAVWGMEEEEVGVGNYILSPL
jgi:hypothetical protein